MVASDELNSGRIQDWRGRDGNDPSADIAKDAGRRF